LHEEIFPVAEEVIHPKYKSTTPAPEYDFKLIRINGFSKLKPVLLDDGSSDHLIDDIKLNVMGWGASQP